MPWTRQIPAPLNRERDPSALRHDEINRLFDSASCDFACDLMSFDGYGDWPRVDVTDGEELVRIDAEMPGLTERDVEVPLKVGVLTLSGERKAETEDRTRRISERFVGRFVRQIPVGTEIDEDTVEARFANGELTVKLPKTAQDRSDARRLLR